MSQNYVISPEGVRVDIPDDMFEVVRQALAESTRALQRETLLTVLQARVHQLARKVRVMRDHQTHYFRHRDTASLKRCNVLEGEVDALVADLLGPPGTMFHDDDAAGEGPQCPSD